MQLSNLHSDFVISGFGCISAHGSNANEFLESIGSKVPVSSMHSKTSNDTSHLNSANLVEESVLNSFFLDKKDNGETKIAKMAMIASAEALATINLEAYDKTRIGVIFATALSGNGNREEVLKALAAKKKRLLPSVTSRCVPSEALGAVCLEFGLQGYNTTISTYGTSSFDAIFLACMCMELHDMDAMLVVCGEEFSPLVIETYYQCGFQKSGENNNVILSEGAAAVLIERKNSAEKQGNKILASIQNLSVNTPPDGTHNDTHFMLEVMKEAMQTNLSKTILPNIIFLSGNDTTQLCMAESVAFKSFAAHHNLQLYNLKETVGELLGAAGLFQIIAASKLYTSEHKSAPVSVLMNNFDSRGNFNSLLIEV